jgi:hypothetical protein
MSASSSQVGQARTDDNTGSLENKLIKCEIDILIQTAEHAKKPFTETDKFV